MTNRTIIIQTLEEALTALGQASESGEAITMQSPPDAIFYAGSLYYLNLFNKAKEEYPQVKASFVFDCGDAGAEVIAAIQDGHKTIKSNAKPKVREKLKAIAQAHGVKFIEFSE